MSLLIAGGESFSAIWSLPISTDSPVPLRPSPLSLWHTSNYIRHRAADAVDGPDIGGRTESASAVYLQGASK
jgi:hypothetical protein